jgi:EAL and modified HD-GYP domain-containing signal transduction protein
MGIIIMGQLNTFIARQPILDIKRKVIGYELFSRANESQNVSVIENTSKTDTELLFNLVSVFDIEKLLRGNFAFLNCSLDDSDLEGFSLISSKNIILEIQKPKFIYDENDDAQEQNKKCLLQINDVANKMIALKAKGFLMAAPEFVIEDEYSSWLSVVSYVKVDTVNHSLKEISEIVLKAKKARKVIVAEKVETIEQFENFKKLGFDFFQGYFFCKPQIMSAKISNPATLTLINLINLILKDAEMKELHNVLKTDPSLSFRLLKYMNSCGLSNGTKVESFQQALMILGYKPLFKWLTILFTTITKSETDALSKNALTRARFLELLAKSLNDKSKLDPEQCFVTGLFSLLDAMLEVPMETALSSINLPDNITNAILNKSGNYWDALSLICAIEQNEWIDVFSISYALNLKSENINEMYIEAIDWSNNIGV